MQNPPYFVGMARTPAAVTDIVDARVLGLFLDSITTDHISPAGSIKVDSPAGKYLIDHKVKPLDFNQYGTRRGNHEVMMRGTFANIRLKNQMVPGVEGGVTVHYPVARAHDDLRRRHALQDREACRWWCSPARNTAPAPRATGRPRAPFCSACARWSPSRSSASTAPT